MKSNNDSKSIISNKYDENNFNKSNVDESNQVEIKHVAKHLSYKNELSKNSNSISRVEFLSDVCKKHEHFPKGSESKRNSSIFKAKKSHFFNFKRIKSENHPKRRSYEEFKFLRLKEFNIKTNSIENIYCEINDKKSNDIYNLSLKSFNRLEQNFDDQNSLSKLIYGCPVSDFKEKIIEISHKLKANIMDLFKTKIFQKYDENELNMLTDFIGNQIHLRKSESRVQFDQLGNQNIILLSIYLKKILKCDIDSQTLDYDKFLRYLNPKNYFKRNEELFKFVYKKAFNWIKEKYAKEILQFKNDNELQCYQKYLDNQKALWIFWLFKEEILTKRLDPDLIMNIFFGVYTCKKSFNESMNWTDSSVNHSIQKISKSLRYLIKFGKFSKKIFLDLFDRNSSFLEDIQNNINNKIYDMHSHLEDQLKSVNNSFLLFYLKFRSKYCSDKSQIPWIYDVVNNGIFMCSKELLYEDRNCSLKSEFDMIKKKLSNQEKS